MSRRKVSSHRRCYQKKRMDNNNNNDDKITSPEKKKSKHRDDDDSKSALRSQLISIATKISSLSSDVLHMKEVLQRVMVIDLDGNEEDQIDWNVAIPDDISVENLSALIKAQSSVLKATTVEFETVIDRIQRVTGIPLKRNKKRGETIEIFYDEDYKPARDITQVKFYEETPVPSYTLPRLVPEEDNDDDVEEVSSVMVPDYSRPRFPAMDYIDTRKPNLQKKAKSKIPKTVWAANTGGKAKSFNTNGRVKVAISNFPSIESTLSVPYYATAAQVKQNTLLLEKLNGKMSGLIESSEISASLVSTIQHIRNVNEAEVGFLGESGTDIEFPSPLEQSEKGAPFFKTRIHSIPHGKSLDVRIPPSADEFGKVAYGRTYLPREYDKTNESIKEKKEDLHFKKTRMDFSSRKLELRATGESMASLLSNGGITNASAVAEMPFSSDGFNLFGDDDVFEDVNF